MLRLNHYLCTVALIVLLLGNNVAAQKKPIDTEAWYKWRNITSIQQSLSGAWITYQLEPLKGDQELIIRSTDTDSETRYLRAKDAKIHYKDQFIAFSIKPSYDTIRKLELNKVKKADHPKDTLGIYWTSNDSLAKFSDIQSYKLSEKGDWLGFLSHQDLRPKPKRKRKKFALKESTGKTLTLLNPVTGQTKAIHRVTSFEFDIEGKHVSYITSEKGEKDTLVIHVMDLSDFTSKALLERQMHIDKITFDESCSQLVFLSSLDSTTVKNHTLYYWKKGEHNAVSIVDSTTKDMPEGWTVSNKLSPYFSKSGQRIFLGTNEILVEEPKDTLLASEKVSVDIWHYKDGKIQPEQLSRLKRDQNKAYLAVYLPENRKFIQLEDQTLETVRIADHGDAYYGLGTATQPYEIERTWTSNWRADLYVVSIKGGKRTLIKEGASVGFGTGPSLSPSGKYLMWFNENDSSWMSFDIIAKKDLSVVPYANQTFESESNGVPGVASRADVFGWTKLNDEEYYLVSDKHDIWALHPSIPTRTFSLTKGLGKKEDITFSLIRTDPDSTYILLQNAFLKGVNQTTFSESIYELSENENQLDYTKLFESNHRIAYFQQAKESDKILFSRKNFIQYPDLESTSVTFETITKLSDANPQQKEYNWGTVEHINWHAFDSLPLRGLLYKPENFDPNEKYPMIVYFYSLNSENIHEHYIPKPVFSYINFTEYVSNGYIVFVPDIRYGEPGHPGKDAYNCVVSGTQYLCRKYDWIDSTKLGIQGQSWGGYQTVQLITMTDMFKAAMAGAAVGNMFSAYGGIRWTSGLARTFQYEEGQSRIGATIWERPELYIENSPVFHLNKVKTPLLLRHNDEDGAVPWYQSIELYVGLRRLQKPVWLLNYNGEDHWNLKLPHRIDYNIRMKQFFDYYLMGTPIPKWIKTGRSAMDKETEDGLELEK